MSFTAEVKDELSRIEGRHREEKLAELAALARIDGTLGIEGKGRYRLSVDTETASVARRFLVLTHDLFKLQTELSTRRSVLHKTFNFLISMPPQPGLDAALRELGILSQSGGLELGIRPSLVDASRSAAGYLRGAFLASGFIADPRGDSHFEITVEGEQLADDLVSATSLPRAWSGATTASSTSRVPTRSSGSWPLPGRIAAPSRWRTRGS